MEKTELDAFVEQMFEKFEKAGTGWKGSYLEKLLIENLKSLYLQFKFIAEELDDSIFLDRQDLIKTENSYRKGEILRKLLFRKEFREGKVGKISFLLGETEEELKADEFFDMMLSSISSMIEHYIFLIQKQNRFNLPLLADKLGFDSEFKGKVSNQNNLEKLFEKLSEETTNKYGIETSSIFSMLEYKIRCACFHCDYSYIKEDEKAYLKFSDGDKIYLGDLLKLTLNLMAKLNLITILPYYFFKKTLPLKGFKKIQ